MDEQTTINILTERGGNLWEKGDKRRIYFNAATIAQSGGLDWGRYNTGNLSSATFDGEKISNAEARRILDALAYSKFWYDLADGKFYWKAENGRADEWLREFAKTLRTLISEPEAV